MDFLPFDPEVDVSRKRRRLPHWFQNGRTYFVTFRLADSLPRQVRDEIQAERGEWLKSHGIASANELASLPVGQQNQFRNRFSRKIEALLDNGFEACRLRDPEHARLVADALEYFDGDRYHLDAYVVMPNHVHLLVCPITPNSLSRILQSWKRHTARKINLRTGQTGQPLWLDENFDHIVRGVEQLDRFRSYIRQNPAKAHLSEGESLLKCGADS